mgnify:CR=1 FL=1
MGAGVLIIGDSKIGSNACIGTSSTIFQSSLAAMTVIEPGSIIGDISRQVNLEENQQTNKANAQSAPKQKQADQQHRKTSPNNYSNRQPNQATTSTPSQQQNSSSFPQVENVEPMVQKEKIPVVGQVYINELLVTLFPHNKDLNSHSKKSLE